MVTANFFYVRGNGARNILAAVAVGSVINELLAPWMLARLLEASSKTGAATPERNEDAG
jgi:hypothetical protein